MKGIYSNHLTQLIEYFVDDQKFNYGVNGIVQMPLKYWQAQGVNHHL